MIDKTVSHYRIIEKLGSTSPFIAIPGAHNPGKRHRLSFLDLWHLNYNDHHSSWRHCCGRIAVAKAPHARDRPDHLAF